jgi:hypothetical protein
MSDDFKESDEYKRILSHANKAAEVSTALAKSEVQLPGELKQEILTALLNAVLVSAEIANIKADLLRERGEPGREWRQATHFDRLLCVHDLWERKEAETWTETVDASGNFLSDRPPPFCRPIGATWSQLEGRLATKKWVANFKNDPADGGAK